MRQWAKGAVLTRVFCALALFLLGFAHQAPAAGTGPYSLEYQLPDGTFASLCLPSAEQGMPAHDDDGKHCSTCVMAAAHAFTGPESLMFAAPLRVATDAALTERNANLNRILSHHRLSRGPPLEA